MFDEPEPNLFQLGDRVTWFPQIGTVVARAEGICYVLWDGYAAPELVPNHNITAYEYRATDWTN
jgi:hypothetical protein